MKKNYFLFLIFLLHLSAGNVWGRGAWQQVDLESVPKNLQIMHPTKFLVYNLDESDFKLQFFNITSNPNEAKIVSLPMPDGTFRDFRVWEKTMMPEQLATKYPEIRTYTAEAVSNATITAKLDFTVFGFHAMIFDGAKTSFIDPYDRQHDGYYMVHYMRDETKPLNQRMHCDVKTSGSIKHSVENIDFIQKSLQKTSGLVVNGKQLRTYRLALSADSWYCVAATGIPSPTIAASFSAMTTSMNRINGVYEREFSVTMVFAANEDTLIWTAQVDPHNGNDPFYTIDGNGGSCVIVNQTQCDTRIGTTNYDIGHVFTTGGGGLSQMGCVCNAAIKAQSVTGQPVPVGDGFDINYVAHEMGHEFGSDHTFNDNMDGSCAGNANPTFAYEPGSGTTIMCYAGICSPDDPQQNSDAYFSASSLLQINSYITTGGDGCAVKTSTYNLPVHLDSFTHLYAIPYLTPFELYAPVVVDSTTDTLNTYCWEQWNLGDFGQTFVNTHVYGPIFRSLNPTPSPVRVFPNIYHVVAGYLDDGGHENAQGEKVPDSARFLTFRLTARDIYQGNGCFLFPDDSIHLDVINTGAGFTVSSQADTGIIYSGGSTQTILWNVVNTVAAPINCAYVNIYMSVDGGINWQYNLGTFENNGGAIVTVPNPPVSTNTARFKVKGASNVFFNVNTKNFTVNYNSSLPVSSSVATTKIASNDVVIYPNPSNSTLHISTRDNIGSWGMIYNTLGQKIWEGTVSDGSDIQVASWVKGVYYFTIINEDGRVVKKIMVD